MKKNIVFASLIALVIVGCSSTKENNSVSITPATLGVVKNNTIPFPLYLTDKIENRSDVERKTSSNVFIVHTGHFLKANLSKQENEAILESFAGTRINAINITLEDFIIADKLGISLDKYAYKFLNSSVVDLNEDNIISKNNISPYVIHQGTAIIGLSDQRIDKALNEDKFLVSDYVLAILRAKKAAMKESAAQPDAEYPLKSFVLVHTVDHDIMQAVLERLPPNFINSLAD